MITHLFITFFLCLSGKIYACSDAKYMSEISDGSTPKPTILLPLTENTDIKTDGITAPETLHSPTKYFKNVPRLTGLFFQEELISDDCTIITLTNDDITPIMIQTKPFALEVKKVTMYPVREISAPKSIAFFHTGIIRKTLKGFSYSDETYDWCELPKIVLENPNTYRITLHSFKDEKPTLINEFTSSDLKD